MKGKGLNFIESHPDCNIALLGLILPERPHCHPGGAIRGYP